MPPPLSIGGPPQPRPSPAPATRLRTPLLILVAAAVGITIGAWQANRFSVVPQRPAASAVPTPTPLPNVLAELNDVFERRASQEPPAMAQNESLGVQAQPQEAPGVLGFSAANESSRDAVRRAANWQPPSPEQRREPTVAPPAAVTAPAPPVRFAYAAVRGVPSMLRAPRPPEPAREATMVKLPSAPATVSWLQLTPDGPAPVLPAANGDAAVGQPRPKSADPTRGEVEFVFPQVAPLKPKPLPITVAAARAPPTPAPAPTPQPTQAIQVFGVLPGTAGAIMAVTPAPPAMAPTPLPSPSPAALPPPVAVATAPAAPVVAVPAGSADSPPPIVVPLAPPVAPPPIPFAYIGHFSEQGGDVVAFLANGDRLYSVKPGDTIDDDYRVDLVEPNRLTLTYLPLKLKQTIALSPISQRNPTP